MVIIVNSFLSHQEIIAIGFSHFGDNVLISRKASFYSPEKINLGDNIRIDDFCILSGRITVGNNIHISSHTVLYGGDIGIELKDFSGISSHCSVHAISDDFSGNFLTNSMNKLIKRNVIAKKVIFERYTQVGSGCTILPGVIIEEGTVVGAMSLINKSLPSWKICFGIPAKVVKSRSKKLLNLID